MENCFWKKLENFIVTVCVVFANVIRTLSRLIGFSAKIFAFILFACFLTAICGLIKNLPIFWQSLVLQIIIIGGALTFICVIALFLWKPKKFAKIFTKL